MVSTIPDDTSDSVNLTDCVGFWFFFEPDQISHVKSRDTCFLRPVYVVPLYAPIRTEIVSELEFVDVPGIIVKRSYSVALNNLTDEAGVIFAVDFYGEIQKDSDFLFHWF